MRRIWSQPKQYSGGNSIPGGTYEYGSVSLPCNNGNLVSGDNGDIFYGGDSGQVAIDANLQYVWNNPPGHADQYQLYFTFSGGQKPGGYRFSDGGQWDIVAPQVEPSCGQTVSFEFDVEDGAPPHNQGYTVFIVAATPPGQSTIDFVYIAPGNPYEGWSSACGGCNLKRATSIAQNSYANNGDFFSTTWYSQMLPCGFSPSDSCTNNPPSPDESWDEFHTAACDEFPYWNGSYNSLDCKNNSASVVVQVSNFTYNSESVRIQLPTPTPGPTPTPPPPGAPSLPSYVSIVGYASNSASRGLFIDGGFQNASTTPFNVKWGSRNCHLYYMVLDAATQGIVYNPRRICLQSLDFWSVPPNNGYVMDNAGLGWTGTHSGNYTARISYGNVIKTIPIPNIP